MTMMHPPEIAAQILGQVKNIMASDKMDSEKLSLLWGSLTYMQGFILAKNIQHQIGNRVYEGPFKNMTLAPHVLIGTFAPHLLGTYENELHASFEKIFQKPYHRMLNIGCSFGYYTTGFALRMPHTKIEAFDIDENEKKRCLEMVTLNDVHDRVTISGEFKIEDFAKYADKKTFILMDIEGAEIALLNPEKAPALEKMDVIVELHDLINPNTTKIICDRFHKTHDIEIIRNQPKIFDFRKLVGENIYIDPLDSYIATCENRSGPTPWAVMSAKYK